MILKLSLIILIIIVQKIDVTYSIIRQNKIIRISLEKPLYFPQYSWPLMPVSNADTNERKHSLPLKNFINLQYTGTIWLGTPAQQFRVLMDTGSADLWVFSSKCSYYNNSCRNHRRYESSYSETYVRNGEHVSLGYLKGSIHGFLSVDALQIAGMEVMAQSFIEVTHEPDDVYAGSDFDGIFGLGFQPLARTNVNTPLTNMVQQGLIEPVFSITLNRNPFDYNGGEILLGGWNDRKFVKSTLNNIPVTKPAYWQIKIDGVMVGNRGVMLCQDACEAVFDTGSSLIMGPRHHVQHLIQQISSSIISIDGLFQVECAARFFLPNLTFFIQSQKYVLTPSQYVVSAGYGINEECIIGLGELDEQQTNLWILGDVFLGTIYSIYNIENQTVSLAQLV